MEANHHYVYLTICLANWKTYIGVRSSRCSPELDSYMGSGVALRKAIRKYGRGRFQKYILFISRTRADALTLEAALVTEETAKDPRTYNRTRGGGSGPLSRIWTNKQKAALRRSMTPERKEQLRKINLGNQRRLGTRGSERQRLAVAASNRRRAK